MAQEDDLPIGKSMEDFTAEVRATAYFLWEQAGRPRGREDDFWYKALDQHIRARASAEKLSQGPSPNVRRPSREVWDLRTYSGA